MTISTLRTRQIIDAIGSGHLSLYKGNGYWYWEYDDPARNIFETESIMVMRLNQMTLEQWTSNGKEFVANVEQRAADNAEAAAASTPKFFRITS